MNCELTTVPFIFENSKYMLTLSCNFFFLNKASLLQVKFSDGDMVLSVGSFIRCWDVSVGVLARDTGTSALPVDLKGDIQVEKKIRLGIFVLHLPILQREI